VTLRARILRIPDNLGFDLILKARPFS
jgi:hypothetical protein